MSTFLPSNLGADAVPDKRTADEQDSQQTVEEAQDYVRRVQEAAMEQANSKTQNEQNSCSTSQEEPFSTKKENKDPKSKSSKPSDKNKTKKTVPTIPLINYTKISHCNGVHFGPSYSVQNFHINGLVNSSKAPKQEASSMPSVPKDVLRCGDLTSDEDCEEVSKLVVSSWEQLGQQLFHQQFNEIKKYIDDIDQKRNEDATCAILIKWRQFNGSQAKVGRLCKTLQMLNEFKAIKSLANRHGLKY